MRWQEVVEDPNLKNLPFKIELNEYGKILMSPQKVYHSAFQGEIGYLLQSILKSGKVLSECAITTNKGVKVADVAWASSDRFSVIKNETACSIAPEICIEIISASNSAKEMKEKRDLYFEHGAEEFWLCDENGNITFFDKDGRINNSKKAPKFPKKIEQ